MLRIAGIDIPDKKRVEIGLTYIFGIGRSSSNAILKKTKIDPDTKIAALTEEQANAIRTAIAEYQVEGDNRRSKTLSIKHMVDLGTYRGLRHRRRLPVRGQRTKTNARTMKGPKKRAGVVK